MSKKSCTFAPQKFKKLIFESMSVKEKQKRVAEMQKVADEYTARTGKPANPTWLAAMQTQGCITILNPSILR
jgi:hypothetical protein